MTKRPGSIGFRALVAISTKIVVSAGWKAVRLQCKKLCYDTIYQKWSEVFSSAFLLNINEICDLNCLGHEQMADLLQTTFSNAIYWTNIIVFSFEFFCLLKYLINEPVITNQSALVQRNGLAPVSLHANTWPNIGHYIIPGYEIVGFACVWSCNHDHTCWSC